MLDEPLLRLWLVRHGQTPWNESGRCLGHKDIDLSTAGRSAVEALATHVDFIECEGIYCSPARRALRTAELLWNGTSVPVEIRNDLREIDFGDWEGLTWQEICVVHSGEWQMWKQDPTSSAPYRGESLGEVATRMTKVYQEILARHRGQTVLVVGHGGSLNALLCRLFGIPLSVLWSFDLKPASLAEALIYPQGPILTALNQSPRLQLASNAARANALQ